MKCDVKLPYQRLFPLISSACFPKRFQRVYSFLKRIITAAKTFLVYWVIFGLFGSLKSYSATRMPQQYGTWIILRQNVNDRRPYLVITCHVPRKLVYFVFLAVNQCQWVIFFFFSVIEKSFRFPTSGKSCVKWIACNGSRSVSFRHSWRSCDFSPVCITSVEQICLTRLQYA